MFPRILVLITVSALAVGMYSRPSSGAGRPQLYIVQPTDTLWSIATSHYGGDPREGVWKLERRNRLTGTTLVPGQRLVIP